MVSSLSQERKQNFIDATNFKEPNKVPIGAEIIYWPFSYAGTTYKNVMDDPVRTAEAYTKFLDDINIDFIFGGDISFPVKALQTLGMQNYTLASDDCCIEHQQASLNFMNTEDYEALIADAEKFRTETFLKRNCPAFQLPKEEAYKKIKEAVKEYKIFYEANNLIHHEIHEKREILSFLGSPLGYYSPLNILFDSLRGIKNTLTDLRRHPDLIRKACDAIWDFQMKDFSLTPKDFHDPFPLGTTVYHSECFLSPKQFDEFFFKQFKETYGPFMEAGAKFFLKGEGSFLNTLDRYRQLPKGAMVMMLDEDDPFEVYKKIGDWATIATGITSDLLQMGTKQQCIDFVKRCFDTFAPGGGFIFMQNKPLLCAKDAKTENVLAVYETANELSWK